MAPGAQTINVDVDALGALAGKINIAKGSLVSDSGMFNGGANGVEHGGLRHALDKFEENWSDRRREIEDALDKTAQAMRTSAEAFAEADTCLSGFLEGGGTE